ncbi:unnamed protein product [Ectocarpus sp. CCAP 1310/34]|nr:unnamed protein product [Ectocarpus sp. CCAP 1310/34]
MDKLVITRGPTVHNAASAVEPRRIMEQPTWGLLISHDGLDGLVLKQGASNGGGGGGGSSRRKSTSTPTVGSSSSSSKASATKGTLDTCGRRFVSRFSVHSTVEGWEGTTGPGTPLWCEYLPPWVLRKEFHTILSAYGVQYVCSERFRLGLGPLEDGNGPTGGAAGGAQPPSGAGGDAAWREGGGANASRRSVDRTVFWNLVVHFREYCLPITFLLADAASPAV